MNFTIRRLWNSTVISNHSPIQITLSSTADRNDLLVEINAPFFNDPAPAMTPPGPFPELWNYEVVELFLLSSSTNHYIELEFSPHGHYIVLLLIDQRKTLKQLLPLPDYRVEWLSGNQWIGRALIPRAHLPGRMDRFNAFAIHGQNATRTYEALYPAPPESTKPDFHRLELFQPLNFDLLLNQSEKDGESWNNHASHLGSLSVSLLITLFHVSFIWKISF
ncbi:hypothetical protein I4U23_020071 [Adineta vaga]|nr:hypothetical protein I4U23_020071 [Adineta vaga]